MSLLYLIAKYKLIGKNIIKHFLYTEITPIIIETLNVERGIIEERG